MPSVVPWEILYGNPAEPVKSEVIVLVSTELLNGSTTLIAILALDGAPEILKSYRKDTRLINMSLLFEKKEPPITNEPPKPSGVDNIDKQNEDMLVISYGKYNVTLPNEFSEREDVGEILKSMIDLSLQQKKTKSSSEESKNIDVIESSNVE